MLGCRHLGEDTQTIVRLLISGRAHIRDIAGDFRRKHSTERVPVKRRVVKLLTADMIYLNIRSLFCLSLKLQL